jgi:hypothetical protein
MVLFEETTTTTSACVLAQVRPSASVRSGSAIRLVNVKIVPSKHKIEGGADEVQATAQAKAGLDVGEPSLRVGREMDAV